MTDLVKQMKEEKIIAIARGVQPSQIVQAAEALYKGGVRFLECTFNQNDIPQTQQSLKLLDEAVGRQMHIGAGTVLTPQQVDIAHSLGATYIVTPNTDVSVIQRAKMLEMGVVAGALTPSEAVTAYQAGADFVKIFPAGVLGLSYIKALRAPLAHIPFFAVGGVGLDNLKEAFDTGIQGVGLGSNLVRNDLIDAGRFDELTQVALDYTEAVKKL